MPAPYLVENGPIAIKRCRHGVFMYNRHDTFVGRGLDHYGEWCDFEIQLLRAFIKPGDIVIDAGANIGTHTVAFANMVGPAGTVHAYEPQPRSFTMLAGNVALNGLEWVVCHQEAVGDAMGEICLPPLPPAERSFNHSAVPLLDGNAPSQESRAGQKVPLVALDSLTLSKCALIKVDVEGMEAAVLRGAMRLIERCRPALYVEHNDVDPSNRIGDVLDALDYAACWSMHPYYDAANYYANPINLWEDSVWSTNLFCLPRKLSAGFPTARKYLGHGDHWHACMARMRAEE